MPRELQPTHSELNAAAEISDRMLRDLMSRRQATIDAAVAAERERCMKIIDDLRISEAGNFKDPKCQGQRGQDRSDALYDAYHAVKNGMGET
jgi:hypothetical protein